MISPLRPQSTNLASACVSALNRKSEGTLLNLAAVYFGFGSSVPWRSLASKPWTDWRKQADEVPKQLTSAGACCYLSVFSAFN